MKKIAYKISVALLIISTFICLFTGNQKGLLLPFGFIEFGLIQNLFSDKIIFFDFLFLSVMLVIQIQLFILFWKKNIVTKIFSPVIFVLGYMLLNLYDMNFKDIFFAFKSLIPFTIFWIMILILKK